MTVEITGLAELKKNLGRLHEDLAGKAAQSAVAGAAALVKKEAKRNARVQGLKDTGDLIENIVAKRLKTPRHVKAYNVGVRTGRKGRKPGKEDQDPFYWWFHEFGTSKLPPKPFLRPAFDENEQKLIDIMNKRVAAAIKRFQKRYGISKATGG